MARQQSLLNLPVYQFFVQRYQADFEAFCFDICGLALTDDQRRFARAAIHPRARVSVVSGTGTGKTAEIACLCLWHLTCFPVGFYDGKIEIGSNTYVGAASLQQVADGVWKEMTDRFMHMKSMPELNWLTSRIKNKAERWYIDGFKETWFITKISLGNNDSVAVAGKHRFYQMIIVDEATGVDDDKFNVITGTQTQGGNRTFLFSQGTKTVGYFYRTHHDLSQLNTPLSEGGWVNLTFSSERAPHVSLQWLKERERETGGRDSVEYRIRVLGEFAEDENKNLINRAMLNRVMNDRTSLFEDGEAWGWFLLVDVAAGEFRDYSVCVLAKVYGMGGTVSAQPRRVEYVSIPIYSNSIEVRTFRGRILQEYNQLSNARVLIDVGGMGLQLCKELEDDGVDVVRVNWGKPCHLNDNKSRFINLRAQAMVHFRDAIRDRLCRLPKNLPQATQEDLIFQATHLPYSFNEQAKYQMQSKEKMRADGIKSPDIIDAMAFAYLERVPYNVSEQSMVNQSQKRQSARERLKAKMAQALAAN